MTPRRRALSLGAMLALTTVAARAEQECYVTWNCGGSRQCAAVYGGRSSGRNGPFASCSGWKQMDRASSCTCGAKGGGAAPAGGGGNAAGALVEAVFSGNQQAATMAMGMMGAQMLGQGIGQMLRGDPQAAARAAQAEEARLMREAALRHERERRFTESKNSLLQQMDGGMPPAASGRMGFKDDDEPRPAPPPEEETVKPQKDCTPNWNKTADAFIAQEQTLREAGADRADLLMAIPQGHFEEGLGRAATAGVGWLNKETPRISGPKEAPRGGWLEATGAGHMLDKHFDVKSGVRDARVKEAWLTFMADVSVCAEGKGGELAACVRRAGKKNDLLMKSVNVIGGIEGDMHLTARVDAAGKAVDKYAGKIRDRAMSNISKAADALGRGCE